MDSEDAFTTVPRCRYDDTKVRLIVTEKERNGLLGVSYVCPTCGRKQFAQWLDDPFKR